MKYLIKIALAATLFSTIILGASDFGGSDILLTPLNFRRMQLMPVTQDFRNYFVLQSIEDQTNILIGDFVGAERKIILIQDDGGDNKIDQIMEYYPDTKKKKTPFKKPNSDLFSDLPTMKKQIISGQIFSETYSYKMRSLKSLEEKLKQGSDIYKFKHGYTVKLFDPDKPNTIMSEFFFGRNGDEYDLIFKTNYYKLYHNVIRPPLYYSVYCERSKDPIVKETVEKLIKYVE